jgi:hypothetical protein
MKRIALACLIPIAAIVATAVNADELDDRLAALEKENASLKKQLRIEALERENSALRKKLTSSQAGQDRCISMYLIGQLGPRRGGCPTKLVVRRHAAGSIFSLAIGKASRKVCIGVFPKHHRP